jgi:antitoxin (DNA-binding transcriptional repressor) of toxin-antitoxin stability system
MIRTTIDDAETRLRDLIEAAVRGEEVVITTDPERDRVVVRLVAERSREPRRPREFGSAKGLLVVPDDFDAPLDEFAAYQAR